MNKRILAILALTTIVNANIVKADTGLNKEAIQTGVNTALKNASSEKRVVFSALKLNMKRFKADSIEIENNSDKAVNVRIQIEEEKNPASVKKLLERHPGGFEHCEGSLKAYPSLVDIKPGKHKTIQFESYKAGNCRVNFITNMIEEKKDAKITTDNTKIEIINPAPTIETEEGVTTTNFKVQLMYRIPVTVTE